MKHTTLEEFNVIWKEHFWDKLTEEEQKAQIESFDAEHPVNKALIAIAKGEYKNIEEYIKANGY